MNTHFEALGFTTIIEKLKEYTLSDQAKATFEQLAPFLNEDTCVRKMNETTAARQILDACGNPPLAAMTGMEELLSLAKIGSMLTPDQLMKVVQFSAACRRTASYLKRGETINGQVGAYSRSIEDLSVLEEEIQRCITNNQVGDEASPGLKNIRRKKAHLEVQIKEKLTRVLQSNKQYLADSYITSKQGHYVVPVQRKFQSKFGGTVIEVSGKGATVFMEPASVSKLQAELTGLNIEEENEVRCILYTLTASVSENEGEIRRNMEAMEILDVLFAKAKLSAAMNAGKVEIGSRRRVCIKQGRHPLLEEEGCVPLDFYLEEGTGGIIITGPNTGGKTVAIKTVGLLTLMAQCGLHIPCEEGSYIAIQDNFFCDIGDGQNITQNLSTFSGHMTNVIDILEKASADSLVLLDELGSGTDPAEGMGIAVAVLEELRQRKCMFLVTTHYAQVKDYAEQTEGVQSARMAFDRENLQPLYKLEIGKSGESCALHIARRLGLAPHLLQRAHYQVYGRSDGGPAEAVAAMKAPPSRLVRTAPQKAFDDPAEKFQMGDSVAVLPGRETAIVYKPADKNGDLIVQLKGEKYIIKHNRLKLKASASQLYPPDYDFSIIFDTVENRKARRLMERRYDGEASIAYENQDYERL